MQRYSSCCSADFLGRLLKVPHARRLNRLPSTKYSLQADGTTRALGERKAGRRSGLDLHIEKIGDLAVIECEGRVVRSEAAFKLREAVTSLRNARIIVLDLSEVRAIEGAGLGMLLFRQGWLTATTFNSSCSILLDLCVTGWNSSTQLQSSTLSLSTK